MKDPVIVPLAENVHETDVVMSGEGVLLMHGYDPASDGLKLLPLTETRMPP
jgi:hypothetical protein